MHPHLSRNMGQDLVAVAVLRGASLFFADVIREIRIPLIVDFISASSYGKETKTTGEVKIVKDLQEPIRGKNVLLVEDVVDSGLTLAFLLIEETYHTPFRAADDGSRHRKGRAAERIAG